MKAALRYVKNGRATGNDHIYIETLKAREDTMSKTIAKVYIKCLLERQIPTAWKNAKIMIIFNKVNKNDPSNYRPICLLSNIYKILTTVLTKRPEKTSDENQPRKPAGFTNRILNDRLYTHVVKQMK